jgi:hypothetical protein
MNFPVALCVQNLNHPRGYYVKGEVEPGQKWAKPVNLGLFWPGSAPFFALSYSCNCWLTPFCMWALDMIFSAIWIGLLVVQASTFSI